MHSGGFELSKLTYTRLENNLRYRGDRIAQWAVLYVAFLGQTTFFFIAPASKQKARNIVYFERYSPVILRMGVDVWRVGEVDKIQVA